jgi:FkbM family methyltransferase
MRKIFLDCGAHNGCSVKTFLKLYDDSKDYEIFSFEGNVDIYSQLKKSYNSDKFTSINKLVWIEDCKVAFNGWDKISKGNTHYAFDFSKWIKNNFSNDDYIILKMDIEGAEYSVLDRMDSDGTLSYIDKFYGELHGPKKGHSINENNNLIDMMNNKYNLKIWNWDALEGEDIINESIEIVKNDSIFSYKTDSTPRVGHSYRKWYIYPHSNIINKPGALNSMTAEQRLEYYHSLIEQRKSLYDIELDNDWVEKLKEVDDVGYVVLKDFFDKDLLCKLRDETEQMMDMGINLWQNQNESQSELRKKERFTAINQPLLNVPSLLPIVFHEDLITLSCHYFGCLPGVGGVNLRKTFLNDLTEKTTEIFHCDPNSIRFMKFFLYLNDVDEYGGPLCVVKNSFKRKFDGWNSKYRWETEEIENIYGKENITYITANMGDLIIGNTVSFHRGTKPNNRDRLMLTMHVSPHTEFFESPVFKLKQEDFSQLNDLQKGYADFLIKT